MGLTAVFVLSSSAATTTLNVTTTADLAGTTCGASCSLRQAINTADANTSTTTSYLINIPAGTYTLTLGELDIAAPGDNSENVTLNGTGPSASSVVIQQTGNNTAVQVGFYSRTNGDTDPTVTFQNLEITGGKDTNATTGFAAGLGGGGIQAETAALPGNNQTITITNCIITGNSSAGGSASGSGGGGMAVNGGTVHISNSTFSNNTSNAGIGGAFGYLFISGSAGAITISNSTFSNNVSDGSLPGGPDSGGAIAISGASSSSITGSTFTGNSAGGSGGAVIVGTTGSNTVSTSVFSGNTSGAQTLAAGGGQGEGGALNFEGGSPSSVSLDTFVNNDASGNSGGGGAIWNQSSAGLSVTDSRFVGNSATFGSAIVNGVSGPVTANDDWWGQNTGPASGSFGVASGGAMPTDPAFLQLRNNPASSTLLPGGSTTAQADILGVSTGGALAPTALDGLAPFPASGVFSNPVDETLNAPTSTQFVNGIATTGVTVGTILGPDAATDVATADNQTATDDINVKANSSTSVPTDIPSTSVFGQPVTLSATLSSASGATTPSVPQGGTVQFKVDGVGVGSPAMVSNGSASLVDSSMTAGTHSVTAVYSGDSDFNTSTSPSAATQTVNKAEVTATVSSSLNPSFAGQNVTFSVTLTVVSPGAGTPGGTGSVQFEDNGTPLGAAQTPVGGVASISTSSLSVSTHNITAVYAGDANFDGTTATLAVPGQVVEAAPTSVTVTPSIDPSVFGQPVTFTATVNAALAGTPAGFVQFELNGVNLGTGETLVSGKAVTPVLTNLPVGTTDVTATYTPTDGVHAGSAGEFTQTVNKASTTTTIGSSANPTNAGIPLTFTATVTAVAPGAGTPTGTVDFVIDNGPPMPATLNGSGVASLTGVTLTVGSHSVVANYPGDDDFNSSQSSALAQSVNGFATTTTLSSSANPSVFGQPVTFTATVSAAPNGTPTGQVQFGVDGANLGGPVTLNGGEATAVDSAMAIGPHTVTATYVPAGAFAGSGGTLAGGQTVIKADSSTGVGSSANPSAVGQGITFSATVTAVAPGAGTPGGSVQFFVDGSSFGGAAMLSGGVANSGVDSALTPGTHTVTATYTGDTHFNGGTSLPFEQAVGRTDAGLALTSSQNPSVFGQPVQFTVTATGAVGTPTGTIQFGVNGTNFGPAVGLSGGLATSLPDSVLPVGVSTITATYSGDTSYNPGTAVLAGGQTVNKANTTTTVGSSANPSTAGIPLTFTATVTAASPGAGTPTGTVNFVIDNGSPMPATLSGGVATLPGVSLGVGSHSVVADYLGDDDFNSSNSTTLTQSVNGFATTTTLSSSVNPSVFGQPVTFTATVSAGPNGTPTGQVQFGVDGANLGGPVALNGGAATAVDAAMAIGTHTVTATYVPSGNFAGSSGTLAGGQTVNKDASLTMLGSSVNPSSLGQPVVFTATVTAASPGSGTPTGKVTFFVDGSPSDPVALTAGIAMSPSIATLGVGEHAVTATYTGDPNFTGSTAPTFDQVVGQVTPAVGVTSTVNPSVFGQPVGFTATVSGIDGTPTGQVQFGIDGNNFGTPVTLMGGMAASSPTSALTVGSHSVTATYLGSTIYKPASASLNQIVNKANTATGIGSSPNPSVTSSPVNFTATVTAVAPGAGTPSGQVQFYSAGSPLGSPAGLDGGGVATLTGVTSLPVGNDTVTATYLGDGNFNPSTSATLTQQVNGFATTTTVGSSANPSVFGQPVAFTATVSAGAGNPTPTGQVQFGIDGANVGNAIALSSGSASLPPIATLAVGTHTVTATYLGAPNFVQSSGTLLLGQTVKQASTATTVGSSANPSVFGQPVNFTATVTVVAPGAGTPTGAVHFFVDGVPFGPTATVTGGTATSGIDSSLAVGNHTVTATYTGDTNFSPSTSTPLTQVVGQLTPTIGVTSTVDPSVVGQGVAFVATVSGTQTTPTGNVQFQVGTTNLGTVGLVNGVATSTAVSTLAPGTYTVTATYQGSTIYKPAVATVVQVVNPDSTTTTLGSSDGGSGRVGSPVVFTATVTVVAPGTIAPTGNVAFFQNGVAIPGCSAQPLSGGNPATATCSTSHGLPVGPATVTATYLGSTSGSPSTSAPFTETTTATTTLTGSHLGSLTVRAGETLFIGPGANVTGGITVNAGGFLDIEGASVHGAISTTGAAGVRVCGSALSGPVTISRSTGLVVVGDDEGSPACAGNTINGSASITNNTGGVEFDNNVVTSSVTITGNTGSVPPPDTGAVVAVGNTISGSRTIQAG